MVGNVRFKKYGKFALVGYVVILLPWAMVTSFLSGEQQDKWSPEDELRLSKKFPDFDVTNRRQAKIYSLEIGS